jgi:hypothetical protein
MNARSLLRRVDPRAKKKKKARRKTAVRGRQNHDAVIAKRIAAGEDPEAFLCIDCVCWHVEPALCACWSRALFPY